VAFDETVWSEDLRNATPAGREAARQVRRKLERAGQAIDELLACDDEGPDGTRLAGCAKTYVPQPLGPWGVVYLIARDAQGKLRLDHLAFGLRHPPPGRRASVYRIAHRRLRE
jgi:hypothetical protein